MSVGKDFRIYASFQKSSIDPESRTVVGVAQVEDADPDVQGDIVDYQGSLEAFAAWPGNIREMHAQKAVGRSVAWWSDPATKTIFVKARVSEGAEDTWKKVLDGTLTGYSIGGKQLDARREVHKTGRAVNRITKYQLSELSLVDSPANPHCVITAIHKRRDGLLEVTDVLGRLPMGDKKMPVNKAAAQLSEFVAANEGDEFLVVRRSDIEVADGKVVLKGSAPTTVLRKADVPPVGDPTGGAPDPMADPTGAAGAGAFDFAGAADQAALLHQSIVTGGGLGDPVAAYTASIGGGAGQDDLGAAGPPDAGAAGGGGADQFNFARGARGDNLRKRGYVSAADVEARIQKALGDQQRVFAQQIDDIKKAVAYGGTPQARKGAGEGRPIEKALGDIDGNSLGGSAERFRTLQKRKAELDVEVQATLAKMNSGHKLTTTEDIRRQQLGREISLVEVELSELASAAAAVAS